MASVSILGSGNMARGIATRAVAGGNRVQILGRDLGKATALADDVRTDGTVTAGTLGDALTGDLVVLAVPYAAAGPLVRQYGEQLAGKVVVDITNPVNFETFDGLVVSPDTSAAQQIADAAVDEARVVKAFNTTFAGTLVEGQVDGQQLDVLIAGDDADAKAAVTKLAEGGGLRAVDSGPLSRAHILEELGFLHMALQMSRGTNFATTIKLLGG